ncbi:MAG TPA: aminotransferase class I/II-fold pyridoxal phosphate-dependent enzyme [Acidimicrobiales bacterium]|nr:aminotransferase class I/II-fold pyridoxal phosphate-dependent enzyme [Acidimicrobiales bacterium]
MTTPLAPPAGRHGGDGARLARLLGIEPGDVLDLSASLNPVAPDVAPTVASHLDVLGRYPDPHEATAALAAALGVAADRVLLTNGGSEAIALVASETGAGWVEEPDFGLYRRHLREVRPDAPRWRSNPHNPSGLLADPGAVTGDRSVWDEAFYPLATGRWTSGAADEGAIVLGSLTKVFACPGLRLGFVLATPALIGRLASRQPEWAVNALALAALPDLLASADLPAWASAIAALRTELVDVLADFGLKASPSDVNYVLVPSAAGLRPKLASEAILVRDCTSFGLPDHIRIAVPSTTGLARLRRALEAVT